MISDRHHSQLLNWVSKIQKETDQQIEDNHLKILLPGKNSGECKPTPIGWQEIVRPNVDGVLGLRETQRRFLQTPVRQ